MNPERFLKAKQGIANIAKKLFKVAVHNFGGNAADFQIMRYGFELSPPFPLRGDADLETVQQALLDERRRPSYVRKLLLEVMDTYTVSDPATPRRAQAIQYTNELLGQVDGNYESLPHSLQSYSQIANQAETLAILERGDPLAENAPPELLQSAYARVEVQNTYAAVAYRYYRNGSNYRIT